jgi:ribosomal peptide maturation radical SAM protein 1
MFTDGEDLVLESRTEVILVDLPFGPLFTPSIGLGLLKAALARNNVSAKTFHFTLRYAKCIGEALYSKITNETCTHDLVGEWIFSDSLFSHQSDVKVRQYIDRVLRPDAVPNDFVEEILAAREKVEPFLNECLERVIECRPQIVGFTSIFQQHVASLSLAKRIKASCPEVFIVFGGANCEGPMGCETLRQFGFVDAVVSGEGDLVFPELVNAVLRGKTVSGLQGVFSRFALPLLDQVSNRSAAVENMDALPLPDYEDYFSQFSDSNLRSSRKPGLLFETSRGCWWGEKHHCTFCGLNGQTMRHRSKTARRALDELIELTRRHPGYSVNVVDNILDMGYFKDFLPLLADSKLGIELFYEVKANLKKDQVRLLHDAGITAIQPGIESMSDIVLRIMRKGVSAMQNIGLLKWCKQFGISPQWNFIWGFPGEPPEEYQRMAELVPLLTHLPPPQAGAQIRIDRFSPNFNESDELGFKSLSPYPAYSYVYPLTPDAIANLAYYFKYEYAESRDVASYARPLAREILRWQECHPKSYLFSIESRDRMLIWDSRPIAKRPLTVLTGLQKFCFKACDSASTASRIRAFCEATSGEAIAPRDVNEALEVLTQNRLMLRLGDSYLALAVEGESDRLASIDSPSSGHQI